MPAKPNPSPVCSVCIRASANSMTLIATDLEITIYYTLECECKEEFEIFIPFHFLNDIVNMNKNCPMVIEAGKRIMVSFGPENSYEVKKSIKAEEFPKLQQLPQKGAFIVSEEIIKTLSTALATTGYKEVRFELVLMDLSPKSITIASTDGSYYVFSKTFESHHEETQELLLTHKIIKVLEGSESCKVSYTQKAIGFDAGHIKIVNTRNEYKFVNFRSIFPPEWPSNLNINRHDLIQALKRCSLSSDLLRTTRIDLPPSGSIKLTADDGLYVINQTVKSEYTGKVDRVQVNSDKLMKVLNQITASEVSFAIHDKNRALVISSNDEPGYLGLVMPIPQQN